MILLPTAALPKSTHTIFRAGKSRRLLLKTEGEVEMTATPTPPWTPEEENKLRELILGAKSVEAIAKLLNRTPLAVRRRASRLKLPLKKIVQR
jgi:hypothetical protein